MADLDIPEMKPPSTAAAYLQRFSGTRDAPSGAFATETSEDGTATVIVDEESPAISPPATRQFHAYVEKDPSLFAFRMDCGVTFSLGWHETRG